MKDKRQEKLVSPQKIAANRKNATGSTGPRTPYGKQRSSQNSYKHGFYGLRLFPNNELRIRDAEDYNRVFNTYWSYYSPVGDLEKLCVEKIAVESLRLARLLGHEQKVFAWGTPFESRSVDKIVRYESSVSRQLEKAIDRLERLQAEREAESHQFESSDLKSDDPMSNTDEATEEWCEAPGELILAETQEISTSNNAPDASLATVQQYVETSTEHGSAVELQPNSAPQTTPGNAKASLPTLAELVEKAIAIAPTDEHEDSLGSRISCGAYSADCSRFIETLEDEELIERIKRGDDLEQFDWSSAAD